MSISEDDGRRRDGSYLGLRDYELDWRSGSTAAVTERHLIAPWGSKSPASPSAWCPALAVTRRLYGRHL